MAKVNLVFENCQNTFDSLPEEEESCEAREY